MSHEFPVFAQEMSQHAAPGYHRSAGGLAPAIARAEFARLRIEPPAAYLDFLASFGPGSYFAGALFLYSISGEKQTIESLQDELDAESLEQVFPIGYDGTTEGCFCLDRRGKDGRVFWHRWDGEGVQLEAPDFVGWVESLPTELFKPSIYRGYGAVKQPERIAQVIAERAAIDVRLIEFDMQPVIAPGKDHKYPRYHRIVIGVTKRRPISITSLTLKVVRLGSTAGAANLGYSSFDIAGVPVGVETQVTGYSFDAFNRPFEALRILHEPEIDLASNMRANYVEIRDLL